MGRLWYIPFAGTLTAGSGDTDLVEVQPADDKPVIPRGFLVGQTSELADAQEEMLDLRLIRMTATVTSGSGGTTGTSDDAFAADDPTAAAGFTSETMNTTVATNTGSTHQMRFPWNLRNTPFEFWFPEDRFGLKTVQAQLLLLRLATAVTDDVSVQGWLCVEEI